MDKCRRHPEKPAVTECVKCKAKACETCVTFHASQPLCPVCIGTVTQKSRITVYALGFSFVVLLIAFFIFTRTVHYGGRKIGEIRPPEYIEADTKLSDEENIALEEYENKVCDREVIIKVLEMMISRRHRHFEKTLEVVNKHVASCESFDRLLWYVQTANRGLKRWDQALVAVEELIKKYPSDEDYILWKAEILSEAGKYEDATAVYASLHKLHPDQPEIAVRLSELLSHLGKPCDALKVIDEFLKGSYEFKDKTNFKDWKNQLTKKCTG